ncbi:MAG: cell division protein ZipA [Gammaproteobacteria bacterium]
MSLRLLLIVIGIAIVVGVYVFSMMKKRREARASFDRRVGRRALPDVVLSHDDDNDDYDEPPEVVRERHHISTVNLDLDDGPQLEAAPPPAAAAAPAVPAALVLPPEHEVLDDLPRVRNDAFVEDEADNARRTSNQLDLFGADSPDPAAPARRRGRRGPAPPPPPAAEVDDGPDNGLINLYVRAREQRPFGGPELVRALNAVGMRYGDMAIFHHFGAGELKSDTPVFSAANMFEPGTFDLNKIEAFRTSGIVLFLQLPARLDGPVAFELLLGSAQRLAELTGGELFGTPQHPLDAHAIAALRRRAARYGHAGA